MFSNPCHHIASTIDERPLRIRSVDLRSGNGSISSCTGKIISVARLDLRERRRDMPVTPIEFGVTGAAAKAIAEVSIGADSTGENIPPGKLSITGEFVALSTEETLVLEAERAGRRGSGIGTEYITFDCGPDTGDRGDEGRRGEYVYRFHHLERGVRRCWLLIVELGA